MSWMWAKEIILPDYIDFFKVLRYPRACHASALERFIGKHSTPPQSTTCICQYVISNRDPCFTLIHRLDMSTSVNEQPHVNEFFSFIHQMAWLFSFMWALFNIWSILRCFVKLSIHKYIILSAIFPSKMCYLEKFSIFLLGIVADRMLGWVIYMLLLLQYLHVLDLSNSLFYSLNLMAPTVFRPAKWGESLRSWTSPPLACFIVLSTKPDICRLLWRWTTVV